MGHLPFFSLKMGCGGAKAAVPKAAAAPEKTLLDSPAEMKAFISKSSVEELTAKLSAMSPEIRTKIMSAMQEQVTNPSDVEVKAAETPKAEEKVQADEPKDAEVEAAIVVEPATASKEEPIEQPLLFSQNGLRRSQGSSAKGSGSTREDI